MQLYWRRARMKYLQAKSITNPDDGNIAWATESGITDARTAVHTDPTCADGHKWCAALHSDACPLGMHDCVLHAGLRSC